MSLLQEKLDSLVDEKRRILKMAHDFEEKRMDIFKEISNKKKKFTDINPFIEEKKSDN